MTNGTPKRKTHFEKKIGNKNIMLVGIFDEKGKSEVSYDIYVDDVFIESIPSSVPKRVASNAFQLAVQKWSTVNDTIKALGDKNMFK